jgi:hypothetical protein
LTIRRSGRERRITRNQNRVIKMKSIYIYKIYSCHAHKPINQLANIKKEMKDLNEKLKVKNFYLLGSGLAGKYSVFSYFIFVDGIWV